jgi:hypothetical protein
MSRYLSPCAFLSSLLETFGDNKIVLDNSININYHINTMSNNDLEEKEKMERRHQWEAFDQMVDDFVSKNACTSGEKETFFHWLEDYSRKEWKKASTEPTYEESKPDKGREGLKARKGWREPLPENEIKISYVPNRPEDAYTQKEIADYLDCQAEIVSRLAKANGWRLADWTKADNLPRRIFYFVSPTQMKEDYLDAHPHKSPDLVSLHQMERILGHGDKVIKKLLKWAKFDSRTGSKGTYYVATEKEVLKSWNRYCRAHGLVLPKEEHLYFSTAELVDILKLNHYGSENSSSLQVVYKLAKFKNWETSLKMSRHGSHNRYKVSEDDAKKGFFDYALNVGSCLVLTNPVLLSMRPKGTWYVTEIMEHLGCRDNVVPNVAKYCGWEVTEVGQRKYRHLYHVSSVRKMKKDYKEYLGRTLKRNWRHDVELRELGFHSIKFIAEDFFGASKSPSKESRCGYGLGRMRTYVSEVAEYANWSFKPVTLQIARKPCHTKYFKIKKDQAIADADRYDAQKYSVPIEVAGESSKPKPEPKSKKYGGYKNALQWLGHKAFPEIMRKAENNELPTVADVLNSFRTDNSTDDVYSEDYEWVNDKGVVLENFQLTNFDGYMCSFNKKGDKREIRMPSAWTSQKNQSDLAEHGE